MISAPKSVIDVRQAAKLFARGLTYVEIGERLGFTAASVRRRLIEAGIHPKRRTSQLDRKWGQRLHGVWKVARRTARRDGLEFAKEWHSFGPFYSWARTSGYRPGLVLRRRQLDAGYMPANCSFGRRAPPSDACRNQRERKVLTEAQWKRAERLHLQEHLTCPEIARRLGVAHPTILRGLKLRGSYVIPRVGHTSTSSGRKLYQVWTGMRRRCNNPTDPAYCYYGAKGTRVCREWDEFPAFHDWALASGWKAQLCLTRKKKSGSYSPANCCWVTRAEAAGDAHHPSSKIPPRWTITAFNETKGPTEWSRDRRCAVTLAAMLRRLRQGWPPDDAIATPPAHATGPKPRRFATAFGVTKGVADWVRDRRCKVTMVTLIRRLDAGMPHEKAITSRPFGARRS